MKMGKRVGIITMHRVLNYGSALQAYALQKKITDLGFNCEIIDYVYPNNHHQNNVKKSLKSKLYYWLSVTPGIRLLKQMKRMIPLFWKEYFKLSPITFHSKEELKANYPNYDIYITGSDQVWNPRFVKDDYSFLLDFVSHDCRKISYASSFSCNTLDASLRNKYSEFLKQYNSLSVRENNSRFLIKQLINKDAEVTVDPTLLLSLDEWSGLCAVHTGKISKIIRKKYILAYLLFYAFESRPYVFDLLKYIQREKGYKVVFIGNKPRGFEGDSISVGGIYPGDFIHLFKNASFVVTTSFHGTAFAVNFGIPFYSVVNDINSGDDRQVSLLEQLGIKNRLVPLNTPFNNINNQFESEIIKTKLEKLRNNSLSFLKNALHNTIQ